MFGLEKLISPLLGLKVVKANLEENLGFKVDKFDIIYKAFNDEISFRIYVNDKIRVYPYDEGKQLAKIISHSIKDKTPEGTIIDYAIILYSDKQCSAELYFDNKGVKEKLTIEL
jgi:hypothetical protein